MPAHYPPIWWATRKGDLGIRAIGAALACASVLATVQLLALVRAGMQQTASAFCLSTLAFLSASAGGAAFTVGRGLLERVAVSPRWHPNASGTGGGESNATAQEEPEISIARETVVDALGLEPRSR